MRHEEHVLADLIRTGIIDQRDAARADGLADWAPPPARIRALSTLAEVLLRMRDEEDH